MYSYAYAIWVRSMGVAIYHGQQKETVCDTYRLYHSGLSILKPVSLSSTDLLPLQLTQGPRSPDLVVFVSTTMTTMTATEPITLPQSPCSCVQGNYTVTVMQTKVFTSRAAPVFPLLLFLLDPPSPLPLRLLLNESLP